MVATTYNMTEHQGILAVDDEVIEANNQQSSTFLRFRLPPGSDAVKIVAMELRYVVADGEMAGGNRGAIFGVLPFEEAALETSVPAQGGLLSMDPNPGLSAESNSEIIRSIGMPVIAAGAIHLTIVPSGDNGLLIHGLESGEENAPTLFVYWI